MVFLIALLESIYAMGKNMQTGGSRWVEGNTRQLTSSSTAETPI